MTAPELFTTAAWEPARYLDLPAAGRSLGLALHDATYTARVFVENVLRELGPTDLDRAVALCGQILGEPGGDAPDFPLRPTRLLLQDHSGVPVLADIASAVRAGADALVRTDADGRRAIDLRVPVDLVVDHSVEIQAAGTPDALAVNLAHEFEHNHERFRFLKWAAASMRGLRLVPPGHGIVHQVHLESLAALVTEQSGELPTVVPDFVLGTDSHTPMVNGLGVLGWGIGGVEATAVALGAPISIARPEFVSVRLEGELRAPATATDLALVMTARLRAEGIVGAYVEFTGPGCAALSVPARATVANMAPEYGCTSAVFPPDQATLDYLRLTGRGAAHLLRTERYLRAQGLFGGTDRPRAGREITVDLADVEPTMAGPKRPSQSVPLSGVAASAAGVTDPRVAIAAVTSCTNTSNPALMVTAGLLARNARKAGLRVPEWVKTSLSPGSTSVTDLLGRAGLLEPLAELGFTVAAYGCGTCIGNSGPINPPHAGRAAVISGNRNFEGRIHPDLDAVYLASPPLVVAYALAGRVDRDLSTGELAPGSGVALAELWPDETDIGTALGLLGPEVFALATSTLRDGDAAWQALDPPHGCDYDWPESTYVRPTPFHRPAFTPGQPVRDARVLVFAPDGTTTDHISPAGRIAPDSPAGRYLRDLGVTPRDFGSYGTRRANAEVLVRGSFGNVRFHNRLAHPDAGPRTRHWPDGEPGTVYDVARRYLADGVPAVVLAGADYGIGSSRDWAAKGPALLGVRAVLAGGFERIHRSNLIGVGILPLQFRGGDSAESLGLDGSESITVAVPDDLGVGAVVEVTAEQAERVVRWPMLVRLDTPAEVRCWRAGGSLPVTLAHLATTSSAEER